MKTGDLRNQDEEQEHQQKVGCSPPFCRLRPVPCACACACARCCLLQETDPSDGTSDERPGPGPCPVCVWSLALLDTTNTAL